MAATLAASVPTDDERWSFEIKWDGIRAVGYVDEGLRLTSRTMRDITSHYPELHALAGTLSAAGWCSTARSSPWTTTPGPASNGCRPE